MKKLCHVSNYTDRKVLYFINVFFSSFLRLFYKSRSNSIWIFGCWLGKRYDDNSRYLFEYILKYHPEIEAIWVTRNNTIYSLLKSENKPVVLDKSFAGKKTMMRAGVALYTNGLDDFSSVPLVYGAKLIHLSHAAAGIKKSGFDKNNYKNSFIKQFMKRIKDFLFDWYSFDMNIATSKESRISHASTYGYYREKKIQITGLPRNDLLVHPNLFQSIKPSFMIDEFKYILYLPTYRPYKNNVIRDAVAHFISDVNLNKTLQKKGYKIVVKLHPEDFCELEGNDNIVILDNDFIGSTQELLRWSCCLITDYSSCCMDFSLKREPVFIFAPDYNEYNLYNGIVDLWLDVYNSRKVIKNVNNLTSVIIDFCENTYISNFDLSDWINLNYESSDISNTVYCENVIKKVNSMFI